MGFNDLYCIKRRYKRCVTFFSYLKGTLPYPSSNRHWGVEEKDSGVRTTALLHRSQRINFPSRQNGIASTQVEERQARKKRQEKKKHWRKPFQIIMITKKERKRRGYRLLHSIRSFTLIESNCRWHRILLPVRYWTIDLLLYKRWQ